MNNTYRCAAQSANVACLQTRVALCVQGVWALRVVLRYSCGQWVGFRFRATPGAAAGHWVARRPGVPLKPLSGIAYTHCGVSRRWEVSRLPELPTLAVFN